MTALSLSVPGRALVPVETSRATDVARAEPAVRLDGVSKRFTLARGWREVLRDPRARRDVQAVDDVDLEIAPGELFGLVGPNGAGKTTLFRLIAGLLTPDEGGISVFGHDTAAHSRTLRELVAPAMFDERSLFWRLTPAENLRAFAALHGLRGSERTARVDETMAVVGLPPDDRRLAGTLSSGLRQRLLLARALLSRPRVLLLDEPTRSLDPVSARELRRFVREELISRRGCTVLLATHDPGEALELCDRMAVLHRGRVLASGTAADLAARHGAAQLRLVIDARSLAALSDGVSHRVRVHTVGELSEDGWRVVLADVDGGTVEVSRVVRTLIERGGQVAGAETLRLDLAELLERVIASAGPSSVDRTRGQSRR